MPGPSTSGSRPISGRNRTRRSCEKPFASSSGRKSSAVGSAEDLLPDAPASRQERHSSIDRRNLRRADWRVLLPIPTNGFEHMVLLGGPKELGEVILKIGLARRVSSESPAKPSADAI